MNTNSLPLPVLYTHTHSYTHAHMKGADGPHTRCRTCGSMTVNMDFCCCIIILGSDIMASGSFSNFVTAVSWKTPFSWNKHNKKSVLAAGLLRRMTFLCSRMSLESWQMARHDIAVKVLYLCRRLSFDSRTTPGANFRSSAATLHVVVPAGMYGKGRIREV